MYTEYFQWSPTHNSNSDSHEVQPGQTLHGSLIYDEESDSYTLTQEIVETGVTSSQVVKCQNGKKYTVPYVVYEKTFPCRDYPPDEKVVFENITIECDGKDCKDQVQWEAKVKDSNCDMQAHIIDSSTISITWDTSASSKYDDMSREELFALNRRDGDWTSRLALPASSSSSGSSVGGSSDGAEAQSRPKGAPSMPPALNGFVERCFKAAGAAGKQKMQVCDPPQLY